MTPAALMLSLVGMVLMPQTAADMGPPMVFADVRQIDVGRQESAPGPVLVRHLAIRGDVVSGELVNTSNHLVRDVRLLVTHTWHWDAERAPGADSPGRASYHTIPESIPPGGRLSFDVEPTPPLPARADGRFEPSVEIVGFTEIGY